MKRYDEARAAHEYLWLAYGPADDMTGGYVDQDDLQRLLESPTKKTAAQCYEMQIQYWFQKGPMPDRHARRWQADPKVKAIAERYADPLDFDGVDWEC